MSYAQIDLGFEKFSDPPDAEYMLQTVVNAAATTPTAVDTCLVVEKGDSTTEESLLRVADLDELIEHPFAPLPTVVALFSSPSLPLATIGDIPAPTPILPGDLITIRETPGLWRQFFAADPTEVYEVVTVPTTTTVTVTPAFPAFARRLPFEVWRGTDRILPQASPLTYPADGIANRDYAATPGESFYLAASHVDSWDDLTVAENRVTNLKAQAESLVSEMNVADWTGTEEVTYP